MFLKNREVRISLDKTSKKTTSPEDGVAKTIGESSANIINGVIKDLLKPSAIAVVGAVIAIKVVDTLCTIAIEKTTATKS